jgi:hypothetical protein
MNSTRETVTWADMSAAIQSNANRAIGFPKRAVAVAVAAAKVTAPQTLSWLPGWTEDTTCTVPDVVSFVLWVQDPMYRATTASGRRSMEMELASSLLLHLDANWKNKNGRVRGWVRKHIEEDLRLRAGGGAPLTDFWTGVREKKRTALLMDYVCIVSGLRITVWWPSSESTSVTMFPMTGGSGNVAQINGNAARALVGPDSFTVPAASTAAHLMSGVGIAWAPPVSISSTQTLTELYGELALYGVNTSTKGKSSVWHALQWQRQLASLKSETDDMVTLA